VVTAGRDGAIALFPFEPVRRIAVNAIGRYAVGSGDAFMAGLVSALAVGADPDAALTLATNAAAANAAIPGAGLLDATVLDGTVLDANALDSHRLDDDERSGRAWH